jgi:beta-1,4-mannosyltransferase
METGKTRFIDHIIEGATEHVSVQTFTWKTALAANYDIFHIHWPERLVRRGYLKTLILLVQLRGRRIPIVRTLHNERPHEPGNRLESVLLSLIDRRTDLFVALTPATVPPTSAPSVVIPHPHYIPRVAGHADVAPVTGLLLYFGIVRPYKGVDQLVQAFEQWNSDEVSLRIVGSATGDRGNATRAAIARDSRITADLRYVPDDELTAEILAAELVVLPYKDMHNSGALLLALSLGRPVLVPRSDANEQIANEVGAQWVHQFDGPISPDVLSRALVGARERTPNDRPNLAARDWDLIGRKLEQAYSLVLGEPQSSEYPQKSRQQPQPEAS